MEIVIKSCHQLRTSLQSSIPIYFDNLSAPQSGAFSRLVFRGPSIHPFQPYLTQSTYSFERSKPLHGALKQTKVDHVRPRQTKAEPSKHLNFVVVLAVQNSSIGDLVTH